MGQRRVFTKEFKEEAVVLARTSGRNQTDIANSLGIDVNTLCRWKREVKDENIVITDNKGSVINDFTNSSGQKIIENSKDANDGTQAENNFFPIIKKPRTPGLPYDDSEYFHFYSKIGNLVYRGGGVGSMRFGEYFDLKTGFLVDIENVDTWKGTGFDPEGPSILDGEKK